MPGEHLLVIDDSPTLLKVVEITLTKAGYRVDTALDGSAGLALVRERSMVPDLILIDGMIPGGDSAEVCRQLAADAALGKVPVVVMGSKGDDLEARFAKAPNVVDYISKPFSPEALQELVSHVVHPPTDRPAGTPAAGIPAAGAGAAGRDPEAPTDAARAAVAEALARSTAALPSGEPDGVALAGDLAAISLTDVLELLAEQGQTGSLRVFGASARVELFFRAGRIDFAAAVGVAEEFLIGRFAVDSGDLAPPALDAVLAERARARGSIPLFGADLVARGLLTSEQLTRAMTRQTSELAYETLRWQVGSFEFRRVAAADLPELARRAGLEISVDRLLLEGFRRVDEWRVIEREIASFDQVFVRNEHKVGALPRGTFTRDELAVLELVNGRNTVREILRSLRLGSFDVSRVLFRLLRAKLIRSRVAPTAL
jgi:CheY-like chemotaxis protein